MGLRDIEAKLPAGFRFYPSDEELVCHYLYKKIANERVLKGTMVEVDLHACEPWELPEVAKLGENEWYFFSFRDRKYATGFRTNRATMSGYWKATGKDRLVYDPKTHEIVGMRKTLIFYRNRARNGIKTEWIMHEFRLENSSQMPSKEDWVLCRVFHKSKGERAGKEPKSTTFISSPSLASFPPIDHQRIPKEYQQFISFYQIPPHQDHSPNSLPNMGFLNSNFLELAQELNTTPSLTELNSTGEDEYGFLLDVNNLENDLAHFR